MLTALVGLIAANLVLALLHGGVVAVWYDTLAQIAQPDVEALTEVPTASLSVMPCVYPVLSQVATGALPCGTYDGTEFYCPAGFMCPSQLTSSGDGSASASSGRSLRALLPDSGSSGNGPARPLTETPEPGHGPHEMLMCTSRNLHCGNRYFCASLFENGTLSPEALPDFETHVAVLSLITDTTAALASLVALFYVAKVYCAGGDGDGGDGGNNNRHASDDDDDNDHGGRVYRWGPWQRDTAGDREAGRINPISAHNALESPGRRARAAYLASHRSHRRTVGNKLFMMGLVSFQAALLLGTGLSILGDTAPSYFQTRSIADAVCFNEEGNQLFASLESYQLGVAALSAGAVIVAIAFNSVAFLCMRGSGSNGNGSGDGGFGGRPSGFGLFEGSSTMGGGGLSPSDALEAYVNHRYGAGPRRLRPGSPKYAACISSPATTSTGTANGCVAGRIAPPSPAAAAAALTPTSPGAGAQRFVSPLRKEGEVIAWRRGRLLGKGAFGSVFVAQDQADGALMAVKEIALEARETGGRDLAQRLNLVESEICILKALHHANIVTYVGTSRVYADDQVFLYLFMEFVPGGSLTTLFKSVGALGENVSKRYTLQVLDGLAYLHSCAVAHRDIKCDNLLLSVFEDCQVVKISDFGASRLLSDLCCANSLVGTPFWMAPEVVRQDGATFSSDVWYGHWCAMVMTMM